MPPGFKDSFYQFFYVLHSLHISLHIQNYRTVMRKLYFSLKQSFSQISQLSLFFQIIRQDRHFDYIVRAKHAMETHIPPALWYSHMTITGFNWFNCFKCVSVSTIVLLIVLFLMYVVFLCVVCLCMLYVLCIVCCIYVCFCMLLILMLVIFLKIFRLINFKFGQWQGTIARRTCLVKKE